MKEMLQLYDPVRGEGVGGISPIPYSCSGVVKGGFGKGPLRGRG